MIVCPVCEHAQSAGPECEVCGKHLGGPGAATAALAIAPIEGLEPTGQPAAADAPPDPVLDLQPTGHGAVQIQAEPTPDVEPTRAAPVGAVATEAVPDIERTCAEIPGDAPTALPVFVTCRYCRTPALPGERSCGRCGMRLPVAASPVAAAAVAVDFCSCGVPIARPLCPSCGARHGEP